MGNSYGFGKFEVVTIIVLLFLLFAYLMHTILGIGNNIVAKLGDFRENAVQFNKTVFTNIDSFHNERVVYLDEVLDEGLINKIKSPFSSHECSVLESKVESPDSNERFVSLRCDEYLIDHEPASSLIKSNVYKVGDWKDKKIEGDNVEEKVLYNCLSDGKELFDQYYEEGYFIYKINETYGQSHYFLNSITADVCEIKSKTFYRTRTLVEEK